MLEAETVAFDAFAFAVAHVSADYGCDAHLRACKFAFSGDAIGPALFVGVLRGDGEGESGLGVFDGDGSVGIGLSRSTASVKAKRSGRS